MLLLKATVRDGALCGRKALLSLEETFLATFELSSLELELLSLALAAAAFELELELELLSLALAAAFELVDLVELLSLALAAFDDDALTTRVLLSFVGAPAASGLANVRMTYVFPGPGSMTSVTGWQGRRCLSDALSSVRMPLALRIVPAFVPVPVLYLLMLRVAFRFSPPSLLEEEPIV